MQMFKSILVKAKYVLYVAIFAAFVFAYFYIDSLQKKVQAQAETISELSEDLDAAKLQFSAASKTVLELIETTNKLRKQYDSYSNTIEKIKKDDPTAALWCDSDLPESIKCVLNGD